jgi:hypothetical protein
MSIFPTMILLPTLVRSLLQDDLLDELRLMVGPVVVGSGKRLFEDGSNRVTLRLVDSKTFSTGISTSPTSWRRAKVIGGPGHFILTLFCSIHPIS